MVDDVITDSGMRGLGGCTNLTLVQRIAAWAGFARDHRPRVAAPGSWPSLDGRLLRPSPRGDRVVDVAEVAEDRHRALWWSLPLVLDRGEG